VLSTLVCTQLQRNNAHKVKMKSWVVNCGARPSCAQVEVGTWVLKEVTWMISFKNLVSSNTMWPTHSLQRHLCVLFLTSAIITSLFVIRSSKEVNKTNKSANVTDLQRNRTGERPLFLNHRFSGNNSSGIIYILGLFELTTKWGKRPEGLSEIAAAELAIKHVNHYNILPDYRLKLIVNDTRVRICRY
jgi:hypothetical protein